MTIFSPIKIRNTYSITATVEEPYAVGLTEGQINIYQGYKLELVDISAENW
jgi:hypothetical protein